MAVSVIIVHGWDGSPEACWIPWLKEKMEQAGVTVLVPYMPHPESPEIQNWVATLRKVLANVDGEIFLVGHSIGGQTILRYLENAEQGVKGCFFAAGFFTLNQEEGDIEDIEIARPWLEDPIDLPAVKRNCPYFVAFFSDNDPDVPVENERYFQEKLKAKTFLLHERNHFDTQRTFPELLEEIQNLIK